MSTATPAAVDHMVFRKTNRHSGRHVAVTPANSKNQHLSYGRIILKNESATTSFATGPRETGFIVLDGSARVTVNGSAIELGKYDGLYIPRDSTVEVESKHCDIAEFSADVDNKYPLQIVRFAELSKDPGLKFDTGGPTSQRHLHMVLAKNIQAGRLVAGFTYSEPGHWTSWPPHEHARMLEEMYVFFDMPDPAFAIQLVYNDTEYPELVTVVRDGDAVLMPSGYHPNVSVPGHRVCFLWAMAAHREVEDRQFGVVNVQKGFDQGGSGLEKGKAQK
jgi:5-deoxy-glucuronate isomerase